MATIQADPDLYQVSQNSVACIAEVPAVVLAGGKAKPELQAVIGVTVRALAVVNGKPLLNYIVDALVGTKSVGDITVVGDVPVSPSYTQLADGGDIVTNIFAGLDRNQGAEYVLVTTSDLPYITAETVSSFVADAIDLSEKSGAQIIYPIVPVATCYAQYPGIKRTARKFKEGAFTGGNMMLLRPAFMQAQRQSISDAYAARKSPARLAAMLGYGTLLRLVLSQTINSNFLSVSQLESKASAFLGGAVRSLVCSNADIATDLDKPEDFVALR